MEVPVRALIMGARIGFVDWKRRVKEVYYKHSLWIFPL
jgi:hypothetical protein